LRCVIALGKGQLVVVARPPVVLWHAIAEMVEVAEVVLRYGIALGGGQLVVVARLPVVPWYALAVAVARTQIEFGTCITRRGARFVPGQQIQVRAIAGTIGY